MKKLLKKGAVIAFLFWIGFGVGTLLSKAHGQDAVRDDQTLFYEISGNGLAQPSHLFGTYHLLGDQYFNAIPRVKTAYEKSNGVVVEVVIDSTKLAMMGMQAMMKDLTISGLVSEEDFKMIDEEVTAVTGMPLQALDQIKPVVVMLMMVLTYNQQENEAILKQYPGLPLDVYLAYNGKTSGKAVKALETLEEQITILYDSFTPEEQAEQLVEMIKDKENTRLSQKRLVGYYLAGDLGAMQAFNEELSAASPTDNSFLIEDRNHRWIEVVPEILQEGNQFIAVGALHLPGEEGLVTLLRNQGYTVTPLTMN